MQTKNQMLKSGIEEVKQMPKIYCEICGKEIVRAPFFQIKKGFLFKKIERLHKNCALGKKPYAKRTKQEDKPNASIIS